VWFGATYGSPKNRSGGSETLYWTRDGQVLCSRRLPGTKVPWEFQAQRPDTDHFNRDFKPESARGGTEICKVNPQDGSVTRLTQPGAGVWDFRASESPDGRHIVFCRVNTGESPALWMMEADGKNPRLLTRGFEEKGADHPRWLPIPSAHRATNQTAR
jgi:TolB protein